MTDALTTPPPADPVPVAPGWAPTNLVWKRNDSRTESYAATTPYGAYNIKAEVEGGFNWFTPGSGYEGNRPTVEAAQAAAQSDFDRRVRECVDATARDGEVVSDAMVRAACVAHYVEHPMPDKAVTQCREINMRNAIVAALRTGAPS